MAKYQQTFGLLDRHHIEASFEEQTNGEHEDRIYVDAIFFSYGTHSH